MVEVGRRRLLHAAATLTALVAGCSSRGEPTPSPGRRGRYEVIERTEPLRAQGQPITDCESAPVDCDASASELVRTAVARRTGCDGHVPVQYFERGLLVLSVQVVEPPYDAVAIDRSFADRLREAAPRSVPAAESAADPSASTTPAAGSQTPDSIPVYAQAVLREGGESGATPDWPDSC